MCSGPAVLAAPENYAIQVPVSDASLTTDLLNQKMAKHFYNYKPELYRYRVKPGYGETLTKFDQKQITEEIGLFNEIENSELINSPTITEK